MRSLEVVAELLAKASDAETIEITAPQVQEPGQSNISIALELGRLVATAMEPRSAVKRVLIRFEGGLGEVSFARADGWALKVDLAAAMAAPANKPVN